ncbi:MAG: flagellar motor switch protein FliN [Planctomycetes bacterium]|nr:flagellar motor switch protein FliN [Planctomycetota bacterium]NUQ33857.1 flagellar motor switch protein FliN [Planctomycetaceae bacterium]
MAAFDQGNIDDLLKEAGLGGGEAAQPAAEGGGVDSILSAAAAKDAQPASFQSFDSSGAAASGSGGEIQSLLGDVELKVQVVLGNAKKSVEEILAMKDGSVVELDKLAGDPLDILVNDRLVAKGEVLVLNENFCIRITDIVPPDDRS